MTRPPTKADLQAAVARLTQEKAELLALIEAVGETAVLPQPHDDHEIGYYFAHRDMAITIGVSCQLVTQGKADPGLRAIAIREERAGQARKYAHYDSSADAAACACGHARDSHWEHGEPQGDRSGCSLLGCKCQRYAEAAPGGMQDPAPVVRLVVGEDEALPDCGGCGHPEDHHYRDPAKAVASGGCDRCRCTAYALPQETAPETEAAR